MAAKDFFLTCIIALTINVAASNPSPGDQGCVLNASALSFEPIGECLANRQDRIRVWGSFSTTYCCQNALNALSRALADQAKTGGNLFLGSDQWNNCAGPFKQQPSVSIESCGFQNLHSGGGGKCSGLALSTVAKIDNFNGVLNLCSQLHSYSSFEVDCRNCLDAIKSTRDSLLDFLNVTSEDKNDENSTCLAAVIISFTAKNSSRIDDFYRCLPALNTLEPENYFKIKRSVFKAFISIFLSVMVVAAVILLGKYVTKNKATETTKEIHEPAKELASCPGLYRFSKAEIENAINCGNEKIFLGRGSAGQVYKGVLPSGQYVAIKQIYKSNTADSFYRELEGLSRIRHPNLVCLFGCCFEDGDQYLVYEYCSAGNLAQYLMRKDRLLTWEQRVKILRDCALALRYLHNNIDGCIVHRDIKLTNILLTDNMDPKLSDFGLAKVLGMEESKVFTDVRGTIGYMDPEYMSNAKLTSASDVYSFGIVALQVLSGQKVIELDLDARDQLTRKAKDVSMGKRALTDFEDPRLKGQVNSVDFESILQIAVLCVARSSKGRPTIDVVFEEMEKVYKNVQADKKAKELSATSALQALDVIAV
ncbi:probable receptor-like protein kinase At2g42960 [Ipomoea triloba]|uniref:probable receptor-like protein kinase At2g42960 n=1 Tax=Ipomoea triloba TaxID=35885 RepID=UPI00125E25D0|nr:probable receptor-like protein kinase At2g42960 [Ipomoea triloba]